MKKQSQLDWKDLVRFASSQWRLALLISGAFILLAALTEVFLVPYRLKTEIVINDAQTSQLQAFSNNFFELSKMQSVNRRNATASARSVDFLLRPEVYTNFADHLKERIARNELHPSSKAYYVSFESQLGKAWLSELEAKADLVSWLRSRIKVATQGPSEIGITVTTGNRDVAYFLSVEYTQFALNKLQFIETNEMNKIRLALEKQRDHFKSEFTRLNKEYIEYQTRPDHVLSLASGDNIANYLSDLMIRKNEVELRINENQSTIQFLGGRRAAELAATRNLGQRSHVQHLIESTELLRTQAAVIQNSIDKFTKATSGSAEIVRISDELKKSSDREFKNFQESNDLLSKLGVIEVAIAQKFEISRLPHIEEVRKAMSTGLILALAILLAQLVYSVWVFALWKECIALALEKISVTASESRRSPPKISLVRSPTSEI